MYRTDSRLRESSWVKTGGKVSDGGILEESVVRNMIFLVVQMCW